MAEIPDRSVWNLERPWSETCPALGKAMANTIQRRSRCLLHIYQQGKSRLVMLYKHSQYKLSLMFTVDITYTISSLLSLCDAFKLRISRVNYSDLMLLKMHVHRVIWYISIQHLRWCDILRIEMVGSAAGNPRAYHRWRFLLFPFGLASAINLS